MFWMNTSHFILPQVVGPDGLPALLREGGYELAVVDCTAGPFTELVLSWNADTPPGTAIRLEARVRYAPEDTQPETAIWSGWWMLGHWGTAAPGGGPLPRSAGTGADPPVRLNIDTLVVDPGYEATAFQVRLGLYGGPATPAVHRVAVSTAHRNEPPLTAADDPPLGQVIHLPVPARSQRVERADIASHICSPTSVGMVLAYFGIDQPTEAVAQAVFDHGAEIYGNWAFNVAYAGSHGLPAVVRYFRSLGDLERELQAGHPVIVSVAFEPGDLPESPQERSDGHLLVVTGVEAEGTFLVNDPAAHPGEGQPVERRYSRESLRRAFLGHGGVGYVIEAASA